MRIFALPLIALTIAAAAPYPLPPGPDPIVPDDAAGQLFVQNCAACHSLDYIETQPPAKGLAFWQGEVTKMIRVYGAPISEADGAVIAHYLAEKQGTH